MFAIELEKLPPPNPAVAAQARRTQNCVPPSCPASQPLGTTTASRVHGIRSSEALTAVHSRPPKRGTANVYGIRRNDPTRFGAAVSQNSSPRLSTIPAFARLRTTIVQRTQTLK